MSYAEVAVSAAAPHRDTFTYEVPAGTKLQPGHMVYVPFGARRLQGVVLEITAQPRYPEPRPIDTLAHPEPLLTPAQCALARWMSTRYLAPLYACVALMLPPGSERKPLTMLRAAGQEPPEELDEPHRSILRYLQAHGSLEQERLRAAFGPRAPGPIAQLVRRGLVLRTYELAAPRARPKLETRVFLQVTPQEALRRAAAVAGTKPSRRADLLEALLDGGSLPLAEARRTGGGLGAVNRLVAEGLVRVRDGLVEPVAPAQQLRREARLLRLTAAQRAQVAALRLLAVETEMEYGRLHRQSGAGRWSLAELERQGLVRVEEVTVERDPLAGRRFATEPPPPLTGQQRAAYQAIAAALEGVGARPPECAFLLHGVTGSGKTEVYLHALARAEALGKRGLVLVPEIALTPQTVRRFAERFPGRVAVLHSGLSLGQRFDQWHGVRAGRYTVVIGPRSALFAPQPELGLIIIDEEHEWTYKQAEPPPRYHAREVAEELARLTGATVVLGSATPDVESYYRAQTGRYRLLELPHRVVPHTLPDGSRRLQVPAPLPSAEVVDLRAELRAGNRSIFSRVLQRALEETLAAGEQAILFLNRRGSASFLLCRSCGHTPVCPSCGTSYSYHAGEGQLRCHHCSRRRRPFPRCPACGSQRLRPVGVGTEGVEEELRRLFPGARPLRWDRDVVRGPGAHERILARFLAGEADVLIGTQMLAKGLDMPSVTLVGVINADTALHLPDFRAAERTFQLLTQVAGRAGRGPAGGRVIIQTYAPEHAAITAAAAHDYATFFAEEIEGRRHLAYPPFRCLARLLYAHTREAYALQEAAAMARRLREEGDRQGLPGLQIVGPSPTFVPRARGRYRWQLLVRAARPEEFLAGVAFPRGWTVDIDPVSLL